MKAVQTLPSGPNSLACVSLGCFNSNLLLAYGSGSNVVLVQANTFMIHQILEIHSEEVVSVAWARTGGRLASSGASSILISVPSSQGWTQAACFKVNSAPQSMSWSFFGDLLLSIGEGMKLWNLETGRSGQLLHTQTPLWTAKAKPELGSVSPDGRLVAAALEDKILIYYREGHMSEEVALSKINSDALKFIKLEQKAPVVWMDWKDVSVFKLYLNNYNPNSLLAMTQDGWVRVWSEYSHLGHIGFNIVFQLQARNGLCAWLKDFNSFENHLCLLAQKHDELRTTYGDLEFTMKSSSAILRKVRTEPEQTLYGASMKERIPVEWFLIINGAEVSFYMCEGLGAYPITSISITSLMQFSDFWSPEATRWQPVFMPMWAIKEEEEVQILGFDLTKDFVRWRTRFDYEEYGGYHSALTAVFGGHLQKITQIECHESLPLVITLDLHGCARVWNAAPSLKGDSKVADALRHWGALDSQTVSYVKWTKQFALLLCGHVNGNVGIYKWQSDSLNKLKLPSMHWSLVYEWAGMGSRCIKLDTDSLEVNENGSMSFQVLAVFEHQGWVLWSVTYEAGEFAVEKVYQEQGEFFDGCLQSVVQHREDETEQRTDWNLYLVSSTKLKSFRVEVPEVALAWEHTLVPSVYSLKLSNTLTLTSVSKNQVKAFTLKGEPIESESSHLPGSVLSSFLSKGQIAESLVCAQGNRLRIMGQEFLAIAGEREMEWKQILEVPLRFPADCIGVTIFSQILVSAGSNLVVYGVDSPDFNIFKELTSLQVPKAYYDPNYILELLVIQKHAVVQKILAAMDRSIDEHHLKHLLGISLEEFESEKSQVSFGESKVRQLKTKIEQMSIDLPGNLRDFNSLRRLLLMIDCYCSLLAQIRASDEFFNVFYLHVQEFKHSQESRVPTRLKRLCLNTMEIAWALHSDQQDTMLQVLFTGELDWTTIKTYGIGIWLMNTNKLRSLIENIVKLEYRKHQEPTAVTLWYMILKKFPILLTLYKRASEHVKIYNFLVNDFTTEEWKIKANKNAFALRKQRRFEMSAAFFLLAGALRDAVEVMAVDMKDPQLALVACRLLEGDKGEVGQYLITKYFLKAAEEANDPWLLSISHTLLGSHSESLTSLMDFPTRPLHSPSFWKKKTFPSMSGFHPSLVYFINLLKKKLYVKRQLAEIGFSETALEEACQRMSFRCSVAYVKAGLPTLALQPSNQCVDHQFLVQALKTYLLLVVVDSTEGPWTAKFPMLIEEIDFLHQNFDVSKEVLLKYVGELFYKQDLRHFECALWAGVQLRHKGVEAVLHLASTLHILVSRFSRDPFFSTSPAIIDGVCATLQQCLAILVEDIDLSNSTPTMNAQIVQITVSICLGYFTISYYLGNWNQLIEILNLTEKYLQSLSNREYTQFKIEYGHESGVPSQLIPTWLRYLAVSKLLVILKQFHSSSLDEALEFSLLKFNLLTDRRGNKSSPMKVLEQSLGPGRGIKKRPIMIFSRLQRRIDSWKRRLLLKAQKIISNETLKDTQKQLGILINPKTCLEPPQGFADVEEFCKFVNCMDGSTYIHLLLKSSAKSLSKFIYESPGKVVDSMDSGKYLYENSTQENASLFRNGVEVYRSKDGLLGFTVNHCDNKLMAVISSGKKYRIREISLEKSLRSNLRTEDFELEREYEDQWEDSYIPNNPHFMNATLNVAHYALYQPHTGVFIEEQVLPPKTWHRMPVPMLLSSLSSNKYRTEKAEVIKGHPMLPLYVTGNESGILTLWEYSKENSLIDFATPLTSSKIAWLEFNSYGDKLGACDLAGNFFLYKFDLQPTSFQPQLTMVSSTTSKAAAFTFLNLGSVVATIGHKPKPFLTVYDTLLPPSQSVVHTNTIGGKMISFIARYQQLLLSNGKDELSIYDLRMQKEMEPMSKIHEQIIGVNCDPTETIVVTGGSEGFVKIWDARTFRLREEIEVVKKNSKGTLNQVSFAEGVLFGSTSDGVVKLLRTTIH